MTNTNHPPHKGIPDVRKALLVLPLLILGCVPPVTRMEVPGLAKSEALTMKDLRPANEKASETFSLMVTSEAYGLYRKGDETHVPSATRLLQHRIFEKLGANGQPLDITVHHLVVYLNMKSELRKVGFGGLIAAAVVANNKVALSNAVVDRKAFEDLQKDEYKRALFTEQENPEKASAFVVYVDAEINGKRTLTRSLVPSKAPEGQNAHTRALNEAFDYFLAQY